MADETYKNIEELSYADRIMTWNFFEGKYEEQGIATSYRYENRRLIPLHDGRNR